MHKRVLFIANSIDNAYKFQQVLSDLDVEIAAGSTLQIEKLTAAGSKMDLIIFEARETALANLEEIETIAENRGCPLLVIVNASDVGRLRTLARVPVDFVIHGACSAECKARIRRLLGGVGLDGPIEELKVGSMAINLATYQVTVAGEPVDFTYLEYALLSYLVQHPNHTFTRDALLQSVWGFDYFGGSRTVDVHVRRIRAKLGPELAQHLETVRGVGYLWNSR